MGSIPQLPAHTVRDAARAVRRLVGDVMHKVTDAILSQFLDLSEFRVIGYAFEKQGDVSIVHLYCEHRHGVALCPRCSTPSGEGHQYDDRCVRDLDLLGRRTFLHFPLRNSGDFCGIPQIPLGSSLEIDRGTPGSIEIICCITGGNGNFLFYERVVRIWHRSCAIERQPVVPFRYLILIFEKAPWGVIQRAFFNISPPSVGEAR